MDSRDRPIAGEDAGVVMTHGNACPTSLALASSQAQVSPCAALEVTEACGEELRLHTEEVAVSDLGSFEVPGVSRDQKRAGAFVLQSYREILDDESLAEKVYIEMVHEALRAAHRTQETSQRERPIGP